MKRIMKKIYAFMVAAIALTAVSCNNEAIDEVVGGENIVNGDYITTLTVGLDNTRTQYSEGKTIWTAGDEILLNDSVYKLTDGANSGIGTFSLKEGETPILAGLDTYNVRYPANHDDIPTNQDAVAGSFDPKAAVLGTSTNGLEGLTLCPYHALVKFTVAADAQSVSLLGYTLEGTITAGETYYIAVEPKKYSGLVAAIDGKDVKGTLDDVTLSVQQILNIGELAFEVYLIGNIQNPAWKPNVGSHPMMKEGDYYVYKNLSITSQDVNSANETEFKFSNGLGANADDWSKIFGNNDDNAAPGYWYGAGGGNNVGTWGMKTDSTYNVYLKSDKSKYIIVPNTTFGIIGNIEGNNWANDITMTREGAWYVAHNLTINGQFKIRFGGNWEYGYSLGGDALTVGNYIDTHVDASNNYTIANGTYDVYLSANTLRLVVVNAGSPRP